jgi:hypothetical protein
MVLQPTVYSYQYHGLLPKSKGIRHYGSIDGKYIMDKLWISPKSHVIMVLRNLSEFQLELQNMKEIFEMIYVSR